MGGLALKILVFGEVLWDVYPDKEFIGGAPFNFAAHFARLGGEAYLLSAVGRDLRGSKAEQIIAQKGIKTDFLCRNDKPTGICKVTVKNGTPSYELCSDVAYDYIQADLDNIPDKSFLYFGTLALRNEVSRNTLKNLLKAQRFEHVYFDINIRQSFYCAEVVKDGLEACDILKISRDEVNIFNRLSLLDETGETFAEMCSVCRSLAKKYALKKVVLTLDKDGAAVYDSDSDSFCSAGVEPVNVVSAVGGGDSFFAAYSYFSGLGEPDCSALKKAYKLSSYVVSQAPAVPDYDPAFLQE